MPGVSAWLTARIGTRSGPTYPLRELGRGWTAASSTCAVAAKNLGLAFMALPSAALPASGSNGLSHPLRPEQDPREPAKVALFLTAVTGHMAPEMHCQPRGRIMRRLQLGGPNETASRHRRSEEHTSELQSPCN